MSIIIRRNMAQRSHRADRFAQMTKQEEIIAKKRLEIIEKQRTAQLAKAVAAAQTAAQRKNIEVSDDQRKIIELEKDPDDTYPVTEDNVADNDINDQIILKVKAEDAPKTLQSFSSKTGKFSYGQKRQLLPQPSFEQPPLKLINTFCNDGSFLENFKKILENHEKPNTHPSTTISCTSVVSNTFEDKLTLESPKNELITSPIVSSMPVSIASTTTASTQLTFNMPATSMPQAVQPPPPPPFTFNPALLPQGTTQIQLPGFFHGHLTPVQLHPAAVVPPPPPPPPQIPIALTSLAPIYMQLGPPPPEAMQLNSGPAPNNFDFNAIQKPPLNLESMQIPRISQQTPISLLAAPVSDNPPPPPPSLQKNNFQHETSSPQETFHNVNARDCIKLPTCIENLIALVVENGEDYEDKIRLHRSELHPALWFIYDKNCEQYRNYRAQFEFERQRKQEKQLHHHGQKMTEMATTEIVRKDSNNCNSASEKYDPESAISADFDSDDEYMRGMLDRNRDNIKRRIECRNELIDEERREHEDTATSGVGFDDTDILDDKETQRLRRKRDRKSRWGEKDFLLSSNTTNDFGNLNKPMLSNINRNDPALLQYACLNYGSTQLTEEQWKQCEEHYKVNLLYQDMIRKRQEIDRLARSGKFKYEYDSDEDVEGGTWEHKLRTAEMEATHLWANALTKQSEGKHHIGDFLPPEELKKFMEQYEAKKNNRQPDLSDYKEYKLKEDNIGFQMLQKLGWKEGQGLGQDGAGIVDPVNKAPQRDGNQGLGVSNATVPENCDNEYDAYRKRMMLAYRFRPNPLNNPRRAYY